MPNSIYPSLMVADFTRITEEITELESAGADMFHMDIMDGHFVSNFALGVEDFEAVQKLAHIPLDTHLMVTDPARYIPLFRSLGSSEIDIHFEADPNPGSTLTKIIQGKMLAGLAINPSTSIATIETVLPLVDRILVMTVNPGFAGQPFCEYVIPKIEQLAQLKSKYHFNITVDGAISAARIKQLAALGVDNFVVGTSALFGKDESYSDIIPALKEL